MAADRRDVGRRLVDVRHRDREDLFEEQPAGIRAADSDRVAVLHFEVEHGRRLELVADDLERRVAGVAGAGDERVRERSPASGSVVEKLPTAVPLGWFSATLALLRAMSVGVSLTFVIVIVKTSSKKRLPASVERTRIEYDGCVVEVEVDGVLERVADDLELARLDGGVRRRPRPACR